VADNLPMDLSHMDWLWHTKLEIYDEAATPLKGCGGTGFPTPQTRQPLDSIGKLLQTLRYLAV
jgi:hypothetical protein